MDAVLLATLLGGALLCPQRRKRTLSSVLRPRTAVTSPMQVVNGGAEKCQRQHWWARRRGTFSGREEVRQGDVLIRLDTERLDNEIVKRRRALQAGEDEFAQLHTWRHY